jgi:hypothetical protein
MNYRGFSIRMTRDGVWLAIQPHDATWYDGLQSSNRFDLKNQIDRYRDGQKVNPWQLPQATPATAAA